MEFVESQDGGMMRLEGAHLRLINPRTASTVVALARIRPADGRSLRSRYFFQPLRFAEQKNLNIRPTWAHSIRTQLHLS